MVLFTDDEIKSFIVMAINDNRAEITRLKEPLPALDEFSENYPALYKMACQCSRVQDFDFERLNYMLSIRKKIATDGLTQEEASIEVGQALYNKYVKPEIGPDSKKQKICK